MRRPRDERLGRENDAVADKLGDQLDAIAQRKPAAQRGRELESFVAKLFRELHFRVKPNAGAARPRQTDVLVSRGTDTYLIECKWRSSKADIDDIDSLRSRLQRTDPAVVGGHGQHVGLHRHGGT